MCFSVLSGHARFLCSFFSFWGPVGVNMIDSASLMSFILLKPHSMRWTPKIICAGWYRDSFLVCQWKYARTSFTWLLATAWLTLAAVMIQSESSSKKRHWLAKRDHWCTNCPKMPKMLFLSVFSNFCLRRNKFRQSRFFLVLWDSWEFPFGWPNTYKDQQNFQIFFECPPPKNFPWSAPALRYLVLLNCYLYHLNLWAEFSWSYVWENFKRWNR